ncbi:MAG: hypothetical protein ACE5JX_11745 [Acidobacteriota bacterium]
MKELTTETCSREHLIGFLTNQLELDEKLQFLFHLETCSQCWGEVYNAKKAEHPHYYKGYTRQLRISDRELRRIDASPEPLLKLA